MRTPSFLRVIVVALLSITLLAPTAFAASNVSTSPANGNGETVSELPLYLQLLVYVSELLTAGEEVPKALLNKIESFKANGK